MTTRTSTFLPMWHKLRDRYAQTQRRGQAWLARLAPRERRLLGIAAAVVGLALAWLIFIEPAMKSVRDLGVELPKLRAQAATVADLTARARGLRRGGEHTAGTLPTDAELRASLHQAGLSENQWSAAPAQPAAGTGAAADANPGLTLTFTEASSVAALRWLDGAPRDWRLVVTDVTLTRPRDADDRRLPGRLSGTATLVPYDAAPKAQAR